MIIFHPSKLLLLQTEKICNFVSPHSPLCNMSVSVQSTSLDYAFWEPGGIETRAVNSISDIIWSLHTLSHSREAIKIILKKLLTAAIIVLVIMQVVHESSNPTDCIYLTENKLKDKTITDEEQ